MQRIKNVPLAPRYRSLALLLSVVGAGLLGCDSAERGNLGSADLGGEGKPTVVATNTLIADWADQIGGDQIELTSLLQPGADPHIYEPVPADSIAFERADLILYNGYNLEPGLIRLLNAAGANAQQLAVGEVVPPLDLEEDGQSVPDPHVWGDVSNVVPMVEAIRDQLIALAPEHRDTFTANAAIYIEDLNQLHDWIGAQTATIPPSQRQLVTTHDAFQYYANAYGLTVVGTLIGISTEEQPSAQTVQQLVTVIRDLGVPAIFAETTINPQLIHTVAQEAEVPLAEPELYADSIGVPGSEGDSYWRMMAANTRTIVTNLGGTVSEP